jgi:hypothetical protein
VPLTILGLAPALFYGTIGATIVFVIMGAALVLRQRRSSVGVE